MGCTSCAERAKSQARIVPVNPSAKTAKPTTPTSATGKGATLMSKLRYTGR